MNRRRFLAMLGLAPFVGILAKRVIASPTPITLGGQSTGLSLAKLRDASSPG